MRSSTSSIRIDAPAQRVWCALVEPDKVKRWQYGSDLHTTWQPGAPIRFVAAWGDKVFEQWGTVLEFVPHARIRYSHFAPRPGVADVPENYFCMTYLLEEMGGSTMLSITQDDPRSSSDQASNDDSGNAVLKALKDLVETGG